jgi:hypothetical protein
MAIQVGSQVQFIDGDPSDVGQVLNLYTSITGQVFAAVHFPRFPLPGGGGVYFDSSSGRLGGFHLLSALVEVGD